MTARRRRVFFVLASLLLAAALTPVAGAQAFASWATRGALRAASVGPDPQPLTGTGEGMELVANVPMVGDESQPAASDIELAGDYAFVGSYGEGMVVVDIRDPTHPLRAGKFACPGGQNDIQLSPDSRYAVMAIDTSANDCHPGKEGSVVLDISDPANPREVSFIPIEVGSHNDTLDWPYLYVDNYPTSYHRLEVFTLADPAKPAKVGEYDFGPDADGIHDSYVDHRPDGRSLLYAASIGHTDVLDVTNPAAPKLVLRFADPAVSVSHQAEPNFDRSLLLVTDEFLGGTNGTPACGSSTGQIVPVGVPEVGNPGDLGAMHLYALNADGTVRGNGAAGKVQTINLPLATPDSDRGCTIHVFWQAPAENRFVAAWYGRGIHIFDFSELAAPQELGWFLPTNADVWAAKPHRGYIFTGDINRGMDVLRYTGEAGTRWPATAGPAEVQRAHQQGYVSPELAPEEVDAPAKAPRTGVYKFVRRVRVPRSAHRRIVLVVTVRDRKGTIVARMRFRVRSGRVATLRASIGGLAGRYRYAIHVGTHGRTLRRGKFLVRGASASRVGLKPGQTLVCRVG